MRKILCLAICALIIFSLVAATTRFGRAQNGTSVSGIIGNSTWTQAGSPYTLTGNVLVYSGSTLTIQPGTTVNLSGCDLEVNGTLQAIGTTADPVTFNANDEGYVLFMPSSVGWTDSTAIGSIIECADVNSGLTLESPAKICNDTINGGVSVTWATGDSPTITPEILNNYITGGINVATGENAIIENNILQTEGITLSTSYGGINPGQAIVSNNTISGCGTGINIGGGGSGYPSSPNQVIMDNLVVGNSVGIELSLFISSSSPTVENNTITGNGVGLNIVSGDPVLDSPQTPTIMGNNIFGNANFNVENQIQYTISAAYNWWGTTDINAINQTIYDVKDNFNLGAVAFTPILTQPNPMAPAYSPPKLTPTLTLNPTEGTVGSKVTVTGKGFAPDQPVSITDQTLLAYVNATDASGNFQVTVIVVFATGPSNITAVDALGDQAQATFTALPQPSPTPTPTPPPTPVPTYYVTVTHVGSGTVSPSDGQWAVSTSITLIATPASNYAFMCWLQNGTLLSSSNPYIYTPTNNYVVTAVFYDPSSKASSSPSPSTAPSSSPTPSAAPTPSPTSEQTPIPTATPTLTSPPVAPTSSPTNSPSPSPSPAATTTPRSTQSTPEFPTPLTVLALLIAVSVSTVFVVKRAANNKQVLSKQ